MIDVHCIHHQELTTSPGSSEFHVGKLRRPHSSAIGTYSSSCGYILGFATQQQPGFIFQLFRSANLKLKLLKYFFIYDMVAYLGHEESSDGVEADPKKSELLCKSSEIQL